MDCAGLVNTDTYHQETWYRRECERLKSDLAKLRAENRRLQHKLAVESKRRLYDLDHVPYHDDDR